MPFTWGAAFLLRATRPFAEIHSMLRWLGVPLLLLLPFAARSIWHTFRSVSIEAAAICADGEPATWQVLWSGLQAATLLLVIYMVLNVWRSVARDRTDGVTD